MAKSVRKNGLKKKNGARSQKRQRPCRTGRATADRVLAQGTGRVPRKAFGGGNSSIPRSIALSPAVWDAFSSAHAPLPRSVGPYTIVRTTGMINTSAKSGFVGTFQLRSTVDAAASGITPASGAAWSNCCLVTEANTGVIASSPSTMFHYVTFPGGAPSGDRQSSAFTCCPAAVSVQIIGNKSVMEAEGQLAAAVVPAQLDLTGDSRTWSNVSNQIVSYFRPRLLSAGKLTLRGVQMDSHPLSMAQVSEFLPLAYNAPDSYETPIGWTPGMPHPVGWAPLAFFNPGGAEITLLITTEWRVRFDLSNPAVSSHSHHGVSSDQSWDAHIRRAHSALPGVIDIVEKVANTGMGLYKAGQAVGLL